MTQNTEALIREYYERFNKQDVEGFLALLDDNVVHDISQGDRETGKAAFRKFLDHMNGTYREEIRDLAIMVDKSGARAAAEFNLLGTYIATDGNLPPAKGQRYTLVVGAFFEVKNGKITRISNHYNMKEWLRQVQ